MKYLATFLLVFPVMALAATPWEEYLDNPTPENATRVTAIVYSTDSHRPHAAQELQILQNQVLAGDSEAFRLGYRLMKSAEGGLAEDLGAVLARSVRANPEFFLSQVATLNVACSEFGWVLTAPGLEYVDRPVARTYEVQMRQQALRSVSSRRLAAIKEQCLKVMRGAPNNSLQARRP